MGNKHSFLEKDLEEESYNQAVLHYIFNQAPEDGGYGAEPARYTAPLGPYNSFYGTYGEQSPSQAGGRPTYSQTIQPLMPSNVAQRPTTPLQSVSPSTTPGDSPLPNRYHSLEPTPLTLPPRPATSPATYPDDENDDNASSRRPTVHVPQTSGNSSPAVLTNHGPTPEPTPQRFPSPGPHDPTVDTDEHTSPQDPASHHHRHHRRRRPRRRVSSSPSPSPRPLSQPVTHYLPHTAEFQYPYVPVFRGGTLGAPQMYPGTARPSGAYVGQMPQNVLPGSVPVTQDAGRVLGSGTRRGYPDMARAAGIQVFTRRDLPYYYSTSAQRPWIPPHSVFPLKAFRGADYTVLYIEPSWDDAKLLQELKKTYDSLRGLWRRCFSLKNVQCITMVLNTHTFIYPQRIGGASVTPHHNLRFRWCLNNPGTQKRRYDFMRALTRNPEYGIEFVERWQVTRLVIAIVLPLALSLIVAIIYTVRTGDVSSAFTIAGYMTSAYSVFLVLLGILNLVEF